MNEITTIRRNATRKIAALKASHKRCRVFSLSNDFTGPEVDPASAWTNYDTYDFAKLYVYAEKIVVHIHDNLWYELYPEPQTAETTQTTKSERCASLDHPAGCYNPHMDVTFCICGTVRYPGQLPTPVRDMPPGGWANADHYTYDEFTGTWSPKHKYTVHGRRVPAAENGILHQLSAHATPEQAQRGADEYRAKGWMDVEIKTARETQPAKLAAGTKVVKNNHYQGSILREYTDDIYEVRIWDGTRHVGDVIATIDELTVLPADPKAAHNATHNAAVKTTRKAVATLLREWAQAHGRHFETRTEKGVIGYYVDGTRLGRDVLLRIMDTGRVDL